MQEHGWIRVGGHFFLCISYSSTYNRAGWMLNQSWHDRQLCLPPLSRIGANSSGCQDCWPLPDLYNVDFGPWEWWYDLAWWSAIEKHDKHNIQYTHLFNIRLAINLWNNTYMDVVIHIGIFFRNSWDIRAHSLWSRVFCPINWVHLMDESWE